MPKATISAPANIAFVKYWGARDLDRVIPCNPSISMTLSRCVSNCTVDLMDGAVDEVWLAQAGGGGFSAPPHDFAGSVRAHLDRIRAWAGWDGAFRVATRTEFPSAAGLASSASGFAALTLACVAALDRMASPQELSALARLSGSGSAARSVFGGYVEWPCDGTPADDPWAGPLASADDWDLRDVIAVVEIGPKTISSLEGHRRAPTSPYYTKRLELVAERLERTRQAIAERDFALLGPVLEEEAIDLHIIAMSSHPPIFYWSSGTVDVLRLIREMRQEGVEAYATLDAGANVHVICTPEAEDDVADRLEELSAVGFVIRDGVGPGPSREIEHLF